jgi:YggT family protein
MIELLSFLRYLIELYVWIVIASVIISWLMNLGMVNAHNPMVRSISQALDAVTEPLLGPIRRLLPPTGGIDFSPLVLLVGCTGIKDFFIPFLMRTIA